MNIIAKIFSGENDEEVHSEFVKFSRGIFQNRYLIKGKRQKDKWQIKTSSEFANYFVKRILEKTNGGLRVKGIIVSTSDIEKDCDVPLSDVKRYMGIKQLVLDCDILPEKILSLMQKHPRAFYALSFSSGSYDLKIKPRPPKSAKPGTSSKDKDECPKADFCSLKTSDRAIIEDLFFDHPGFNEIKINHIVEIKEIDAPENAKTPEEMREKAVRKGVIKRLVEVDGKKEIKEKSFEV